MQIFQERAKLEQETEASRTTTQTLQAKQSLLTNEENALTDMQAEMKALQEKITGQEGNASCLHNTRRPAGRAKAKQEQALWQELFVYKRRV